MLELNISPPRGVRGLLQEDGIAGDFANVDGDAEVLCGEYAIHQGDVLVCEIAGNGENEDTGLEGWRGLVVVCGEGVGGGYGGGGGGLLGYVGEGEGESAGDGGCGVGG